MVDLATWLEAHASILTHAAAEALSDDETLQSQAVSTVEVFHQSLLRAALAYDATPLYGVLFDWVEARSAPTDNTVTSLVPVIAKLKQATAEQIVRLTAPGDAVALLMAADAIYTDALVFLAQLEADALLAQGRTREQTALDQVRHLDKRKSDFIAIAAHELKTPLTVIEGYLGIIRGAVPVTEDASLSMCVGGVDSGVRRMREIVDDLMDVSMIELRLLRLRYQPVWLQHVVRAVERSCREAVEERRLTLAVAYESLPPHATYADPERLLQVVMKVVGNAIKYTPDDGTITVSARLLPGFVDLMVEDTGIGIEPRHLARIFDAFSGLSNAALHSSSKTRFKGGGPGLGLPIARGLIEAHGGSIWAVSPGYNEQTCPGSTFHIMIPMRDAPPPEEGSVE